jgi:hypothetical protein
MVCKAATFTGLNEQNRRWRNWNEDIQFQPTEYFEPAHSAPDVNDGLLQLVHVVARATDEAQALHAVGSCWAFEDVAASSAWTVSLRQLDRELTFVVGDAGAALSDEWRTRQADAGANAGAGRRLVHTEAGIRIATLNERLTAQGLAMPVLGGANGQALAGVVSTSTHGGDWQQPPFPDLVKAIHLVTHGGRELWIERASEPITTDERLRPRLPCASTEIVRDDGVFDAALVACGRFGVIYAFVLEVRRSLRVVEVINTPMRADVMNLLREGQANATLFQPLFDHLETLAKPAGLDDATGEPYFLQMLFNSQNPEDMWVHRRWETTVADDLPAPPPLPPGGSRVTASGTLHDLAEVIVSLGNVALVAAAGVVALTPIIGPGAALYILGLTVYLNGLIATRNFRFGSVVSAVLDALWKVPAASHAIPGINFMVIDAEYRTRIAAGRRGPHHLMTSGDRAGSDQNDFRVDSIELVFDATRADYLDFLDDVLARAPTFQQAGIISLRPSRRSRALLSMHHVEGSHAISIEIASLKFLPGNAEWLQYVHRAAVQRNGRPHWGQFNKLSEFNVAMLYGRALNQWREALLRVSGDSVLFSNDFCRARGLEPRSIARQVTGVMKTPIGEVITHLCNDGAHWSPVSVGQAIDEIESGTIQYYTQEDERLAIVHVVHDRRAGSYLRSGADATGRNNLDNL